ncbi:MAG: hypothetical protein HRU35_01310 [Rickettsiaceae bacterium]|nr:hypothetical protein [Rickettsiaceae bacterium]
MQVFSRIFIIFFTVLSLTSCSKLMNKQDSKTKPEQPAKKSIISLFKKQNKENISITEVKEGELIAGLTNSRVGKSMDDTDKRLAKSSLIRALESGLSNHSIKWRNPDNSHSGLVTPVKNSNYKGKYCRMMIQEVSINNKTKKVKSKICRKAGGGWEIAK